MASALKPRTPGSVRKAVAAQMSDIGLTEAHVQQTCTEFLISDGWHAIRTELTVQKERGRVVGEVGMPDHLYIRYYDALSDRSEWPAHLATSAQVLWIEFKRPGRHPTKQQFAWHKAERARGALVLVVDDIDGFMAWYKASGLQRR